MTLPRIVIPGAIVLITRRCLGRQFLLRPDPLVVAAFEQALSRAAAMYGIAILGVVQMSNHYHIVAHDRHGRFPRFIGWMNAQLTHDINAVRGRSDTMWEARQTSVVELGDAETVLEALAYVHLNPMSAGLVSDPALWPGLITGPDDFEPPEAAGAVRSGLPVTVPPTHAHLPPGEFAARLRARIKARAHWLRTTMTQQGRSCGTPQEALDVAWQASPSQTLGKGETEDDREDLLTVLRRRLGLGMAEVDEEVAPEAAPGHARPSGQSRRPRAINPTVKAATPDRRARMLARLRTFRDAYAKALKRLRSGVLATFPGGTWQLCRTLLFRADPAPLPAWRLA